MSLVFWLLVLNTLKQKRRDMCSYMHDIDSMLLNSAHVSTVNVQHSVSVSVSVPCNNAALESNFLKNNLIYASFLLFLLDYMIYRILIIR